MIRRLQIRFLKARRALRKQRFLLGERTFKTLLILLFISGVVFPFLLKALQTNRHADLGISVLVDKNYNCNDPSEAQYAHIDAPESAGFGIIELPEGFERDREKSINYGALKKGGRLPNQVLFEKLDDLSLWNVIGALIAGFFLLLAIRNANHLTRISWTGIFLAISICSISIWIYVKGLPGEPLIRLYGTLYCTSPDDTIKLIQRLEGWNNVLFIIPLISIIATWGLHLANHSRVLAGAAREPKKTARILSSLFNGPIWGIAAMLIGYFAFRYTLPYHDSRHCVHTSVLGLIVWHWPFWAMTALAWVRSRKSETWEVNFSAYKVIDKFPVPYFKVKVIEPVRPLLRALREIQKEKANAEDPQELAEIEATIQKLTQLSDLDEQRMLLYTSLGDQGLSNRLLEAAEEFKAITVHGPDTLFRQPSQLQRSIRNRKLHDFGNIIISAWQRSRQVCLIKVNGNWQGTGFLVGEDKILTNYHVLFDRELGSAGEMNAELRSTKPKITVEFDYVSFGGNVSNRQPDISLVLDEPVLCGSQVSPFDSTGSRMEPLSSYPNDHDLDFVLLRIDHPAAKQEIVTMDGYRGTKKSRRGCIQLPLPDHVNYPDREITILQHPKGFTLSMAQGIVIDDSEARIRYAASTDEGSSGSPCFLFEEGFPLIGLHHSSDPRFSRAQYNQAISASAIVRFIHENMDPTVLAELAREQNELSDLNV